MRWLLMVLLSTNTLSVVSQLVLWRRVRHLREKINIMKST